MLAYEQADWIIHTDKKEFFITEKQYQFMKTASSNGQTIIWFDDLTISIPHISYMEKIRRTKYIPLPELPTEVIDSKKVEDIKSQLKDKLSWKNQPTN